MDITYNKTKTNLSVMKCIPPCRNTRF